MDNLLSVLFEILGPPLLIYILLGIVFAVLMLAVNKKHKLEHAVNATVIGQLILLWLPIMIAGTAAWIKDRNNQQ